jgi:peptidoglycan/xylan/chitin deacetylase (PgdA/CDA1 family)
MNSRDYAGVPQQGRMQQELSLAALGESIVSTMRGLASSASTHARAFQHRLLSRPKIVYRAADRPPAVALTFDDGPSEWTLEIARALEVHGCRGTFFVLGSSVERRPAVIKALAEAGHEIGSHLWSHEDPEQQSRVALRAEMERAAGAISAAGGGRPRLVRPPYCGAPDAVARAASFGGVTHIVLRSVDPVDWRAESPAEIVEAVLGKIGPGDIVCMHDGISPMNKGTKSRGPTAAAVAELVPALLKRGLRPVTVSELLG